MKYRFIKNSIGVLIKNLPLIKFHSWMVVEREFHIIAVYIFLLLATPQNSNVILTDLINEHADK